MSDDCVFTSLVTARDYSPPSRCVWYCQFDVSPVNFSDSDARVSSSFTNEKDHLYFLVIRLFMCFGEFFDGRLGQL